MYKNIHPSAKKLLKEIDDAYDGGFIQEYFYELASKKFNLTKLFVVCNHRNFSIRSQMIIAGFIYWFPEFERIRKRTNYLQKFDPEVLACAHEVYPTNIVKKHYKEIFTDKVIHRIETHVQKRLRSYEKQKEKYRLKSKPVPGDTVMTNKCLDTKGEIEALQRKIDKLSVGVNEYNRSLIDYIRFIYHRQSMSPAQVKKRFPKEYKEEMEGYVCYNSGNIINYGGVSMGDSIDRVSVWFSIEGDVMSVSWNLSMVSNVDGHIFSGRSTRLKVYVPELEAYIKAKRKKMPIRKAPIAAL